MKINKIFKFNSNGFSLSQKKKFVSIPRAQEEFFALFLSANFRSTNSLEIILALSSHSRHDDHELFSCLRIGALFIPAKNTRESSRVSRNSPPPHLGNPPLAQHTLREMRCVLHLNAGHLELSGCVPSFFRTSFTISRSGKLRRGSFLSWSEQFSKCGEILFTREYNSFRIIVLLMEIKGWWRF